MSCPQFTTADRERLKLVCKETLRRIYTSDILRFTYITTPDLVRMVHCENTDIPRVEVTRGTLKKWIKINTLKLEIAATMRNLAEAAAAAGPERNGTITQPAAVAAELDDDEVMSSALNAAAVAAVDGLGSQLSLQRSRSAA